MAFAFESYLALNQRRRWIIEIAWFGSAERRSPKLKRLDRRSYVFSCLNLDLSCECLFRRPMKSSRREMNCRRRWRSTSCTLRTRRVELTSSLRSSQLRSERQRGWRSNSETATHHQVPCLLTWGFMRIYIFIRRQEEALAQHRGLRGERAFCVVGRIEQWRRQVRNSGRKETEPRQKRKTRKEREKREA